MTVQLARAARRPGTIRDGPAVVLRSPFASGAVAAVWAAGLGLVIVCVPVALAWLLAPHGPGRGIDATAGVSVWDALHVGVLAWLAAQHSALHTSAGTLTLLPLGLLAVPVFALYRCGRWAGRVSVDALPAALAATGSLTGTYAIATAVVSSLASDSTLGVATAPVAAASVLLGVLAGGAGVLTGGRMWAQLAGRAPESIPHVVRGAVAGLAVLLGGGALAVAAALVAHFARVLALTRSLQAGAPGGAALMVLGAVFVPTAVVWAAAYAVGPGFGVGIGTVVAPAGVALGPVPAFPLLGVLPGAGKAPGVSLLVLAVPVMAGALIGVMAARRPARTPGRTVAEASASGAVAGLALGVLAWLSAGSLGAVRMSQIGPNPLAVAAVAALELAVVAAAVAWEADRHAALFAQAATALRTTAAKVRHRGRTPSAPRRAGLWRRHQSGGASRGGR